MSIRILIGDVREKLREIEPDSVDCVVTSPPYWGLRDYGVEGQIGMEPTLGEHLAVLVEVFREVRRVMKPEASLWLNYGDCYATSPNGRSAAATKATGNDDRTFRDKPFSTVGGTLKPKDLCLVANRLTQALQEPYYTGDIKRLEDRVWLAAIIDGEGSIFIHRQPEGSPTGRRAAGYLRNHDNFCVGIAISNTSEAIVRRAACICGKANISTYHQPEGSHRRTHYQWRVTGNVAKRILQEIYPFLVGKKQEARIAIACPPSGEVAKATWLALKDLHKKGQSDFDAKPPLDLFEQGFWVRAENIWGKPNPMPDSSGRYRPSTAHEKVWLLTKSAKSFYDSEAVRMPPEESTVVRLSQDVEAQAGSNRANAGGKTNGPMKAVGRANDKQRGHSRRHQGFNDRWDQMERDEQITNGRLFRNYEPEPWKHVGFAGEVWKIAPVGFSEAHFATFPPALVEPCIAAGCPIGGTVLDPFGGAGTTGMVADRMGRDAILIELNPEYADIARRRISRDAGMFAEVSS